MRVKAAAQVVPALVARVAGGVDAASQLQQQLFGGGAGEIVGRGGGKRVGGGAAQFDHGFFGFPARQDGVETSMADILFKMDRIINAIHDTVPPELWEVILHKFGGPMAADTPIDEFDECDGAEEARKICMTPWILG